MVVPSKPRGIDLIHAISRSVSVSVCVFAHGYLAMVLLQIYLNITSPLTYAQTCLQFFIDYLVHNKLQLLLDCSWW